MFHLFEWNMSPRLTNLVGDRPENCARLNERRTSPNSGKPSECGLSSRLYCSTSSVILCTGPLEASEPSEYSAPFDLRKIVRFARALSLALAIYFFLSFFFAALAVYFSLFPHSLLSFSLYTYLLLPRSLSVRQCFLKSSKTWTILYPSSTVG